MIVRLTFCKFIPERMADAKKVYNEEVIPVVKKAKRQPRLPLVGTR